MSCLPHLSREDAPLGMSHVPHEVIQHASGHLSKVAVPSQCKGIQVGAGKLRVVIQHLLKVWDVPKVIHAVSVEAAANLIIHASLGHLLQSVCCHCQRLACTIITQLQILQQGDEAICLSLALQMSSLENPQISVMLH